MEHLDNVTLEHGRPMHELTGSKISDRFQEHYQESNFWLAANIVCLLCGIITVARMGLALIIRQRARYVLRIGDPNDPSNDVRDIFSVFCCYMCALCQLKTTIEESEDLEMGGLCKPRSKLGFFDI